MLGKMKVCSLVCASLLSLGTLAATQAEAAPRALVGFFKQIHQSNDMGRDEKGEHELLHQNFAGLAVDAELRKLHPELGAAIEARTKADWDRAQRNRKAMTKEANDFRKAVPDNYRPFTQDVDVLMRRADDYVVSYLEMEYTDTGGAHGMYGWQGVNLITDTGEELSLFHVVKDTGKLTELIIDQLKKDYPDAPFFDLEKTVRRLALQGELNWTIDPRGLTFYFNPYAIAPYSEGLLTATILFKEHPQIFNEYYLDTAPEYAQPFPSYYKLVTSLNDSATRDTISVWGGVGKLHVVLNGTDTAWEVPWTDLKPVLVHMKDKRNYLYIDGCNPEGVRQTIVFKLSRGKVLHVGTLPYTFLHTIVVSPAEQHYYQFLTNPEGFYFDRSAGPGHSTKTDICGVGEDGLLTYG